MLSELSTTPCLSQNLGKAKKKIVSSDDDYVSKLIFVDLYPVDLITEVSPQSQAPPAWLLNILKSWPSCWPFRKQSAHNDMHGDIPQVRHL